MEALGIRIVWALVMALGLAGLAVVADRWLRRPALAHGLWVLVLLRLVSAPVPLPGWTLSLPWPNRWRDPAVPVMASAASVELGGEPLDPASSVPGVDYLVTSIRPERSRPPERKSASLEANSFAPPVGASATPVPAPASLSRVSAPSTNAVRTPPSSGREPAGKSPALLSERSARAAANGARSTSGAAVESEPVRWGWGVGPTGRAVALLASNWAWCWLAGSVVAAVAVAWRVIRFEHLLAASAPATEETRSLAERLAKELGLRRTPVIRSLPGRVVPFVWCLGRPRIYLPTDDEAEPAARELILLHELTHVARGDHRVRWLETLTTLTWWWNPLLWWARRELRRVEEEACDERVLVRRPHAGPDYAALLVNTVGGRAGLFRSALVCEAGEIRNLSRRVSMILAFDGKPRCRSRLAPALAVTAALLLVPLTPQLSRAQTPGTAPTPPLPPSGPDPFGGRPDKSAPNAARPGALAPPTAENVPPAGGLPRTHLTDRVAPPPAVKPVPAAPPGPPVPSGRLPIEFLPPYTPVEKRIEQELERTISVNLDNTPVSDAIEFLSSEIGVTIILDPAAVKELQIERDTPMTLKVEKIQFASVLRRLLAQLHLTYQIEDEVLLLTSEKLGGGLVTRTYPVGDLVGPNLVRESFLPPPSVSGAGMDGSRVRRAARSVDRFLGESLTAVRLRQPPAADPRLSVTPPLGTGGAAAPAGGSGSMAPGGSKRPGGSGSVPGLSGGAGMGIPAVDVGGSTDSGRGSMAAGGMSGTMGGGMMMGGGGGAVRLPVESSGHPGYDNLVRCLRGTTDPGVWVEQGGGGSIIAMPSAGSIVVRASRSTHAEILRTLRSLRAAMAVQRTTPATLPANVTPFTGDMGAAEAPVPGMMLPPPKRPQPVPPGLVPPPGLTPAEGPLGGSIPAGSTTGGSALGGSAPGGSETGDSRPELPDLGISGSLSPSVPTPGLSPPSPTGAVPTTPPGDLPKVPGSAPKGNPGPAPGPAAPVRRT